MLVRDEIAAFKHQGSQFLLRQAGVAAGRAVGRCRVLSSAETNRLTNQTTG